MMRQSWPDLREGGASTAESAIVATVFLTLIISVFDAATIARSHLAARYGSSAGARAAAIASNDTLADFDMLRAIDRAAKTTSNDAIETIVVFRASGPGDTVPSACLTHPVAGLCNTYTGFDLSRPASDFAPGGWAADDYWAPSTRRTSRIAGADYLGVYVKVKVGSPIGPLPKQLDDTAIELLESVDN